MNFKTLYTLTILLCFSIQLGFSQIICDNRCLDFDGQDDYVQANSPLTGDPDFTLEVWLKLNNASAGPCNPFNVGTMNRLMSWQNQVFEIAECAGNLLIIDRSAAPFGPLTGLGAMPINDGTWHHLAYSKTGTQARVYFDGNFLNNYPTSTQSQNFDLGTFFRLGEQANGFGPNWNGRIDELRLWNYGRTEAEITNDRNCYLRGSEAGLVLYYNFNHGVPAGSNPNVTVVDDLTLNNNDGQLNQFQLEGDISNWRCSNVDLAGLCMPANCMAAFEYITNNCGEVNFIDQSTGTNLSYLWDFGDGNTSILQNPTHVYLTGGTYTVCLTVSTGNCQNTICNNVSVTVDNEPPLITCPLGFNAFTDMGECSAILNVPFASATDNCDGNVRVACNRTDGLTMADPFPKGPTLIICTATDESGNAADCEFVVNVIDSEPPQIVCPQGPIQATAPQGANGTTVTFPPPFVTDNCPMWVVNCSPASGDFFPCGSTFVNCVITDMQGNQTECAFEVIVDCQGPSIDTLCGWTVATCYSSGPTEPVGVIYDVSHNSLAPIGDDWGPTIPQTLHPANWVLDSIGQVFGTAFDNIGHIYLSATDIYRYQTTNLGLIPKEGKAGTGGIYIARKNNAFLAETFVGTQSVASLNTVGTSFIPNTGGVGNGIGNIAFDRYNNQFFATNLEDGRIYRINTAGVVQSIYDPFTLDSGTTGLAMPARERIWGIGVFERGGQVRVYFAREAQVGSNSKEIHSIGLTGGGEFLVSGGTNTAGLITGSADEQMEPVTLGGTMPTVTDIAFSFSGNMLVAERGDPHAARVMEYTFDGTNWNFLRKYFTGWSAGGNNAAGGVDYGYKEVNDDVRAICDGLVWATGHNNRPASGLPSPGRTYGIQGMDAFTGNAIYPSNAATDIFVDFDGVYNYSDKRRLGDVEIFKCDCPGIGGINCDSLMVMETLISSPVEDRCCYSIDLKNQVGSNITKVCVDINTADWIFNTGQLSLLGGYTFETVTSTRVCFEYSGGFPSGNLQNVFTFCMTNTDPSAAFNQELVFSWFDAPKRVVCRDTIITECEFIVPDPCLVLENLRADCSQENDYEYCVTFDVTNQSGYDAYGLVLENLPPGYAFGDCGCGGAVYNVNDYAFDWFSNPLTNNGTRSLCVKIISGLPILSPTDICFNSSIEGLIECCSSPEDFCVTLNPCCDPCESISMGVENLTSQGDSCCFNIDVNYDCDYSYFTKIQFDILTLGVYFGSHYIGDPLWNVCGVPTLSSVCIQPIVPEIPPGNYDDLFNFCLTDIDNASEIPQVIKVTYWTLGSNGKDSIACDTLLRFECDLIQRPCSFTTEERIECIPDSNKYRITVTVQNVSNPSFTAEFLAFLPLSPELMPNPVPLVPPLPNDGSTRTISFCYTPTTFPDPDGLLTLVYRLKDLEGDSCCNGNDMVFDTLRLPDCPGLDPCDSLDLSWRFDNSMEFGKCCWNVTVVNNYASNQVKFVEVGNPTGAAGLSVYPHGGWTVSGSGPYQVGPGGFIPTGTYTNEFTVCLNGITSGLQQFPLSFGIVDLTNPANCSLECEELVVADCEVSQPCECSYSDFNLQMGNGNYTLACNSQTQTLDCPINDIFIKGQFFCQTNCEAGKWIDWKLTHLPTGNVNTGIVASPNINIALPTNMINQPGDYELVMVGSCNGRKCECVIRFTIKDCEDPGCTCEKFKEDFEQAFEEFYFPGDRSCKRLFTPKGLRKCDRLKWTLIDNLGNATLASSFGNQTVSFLLVNGRTYKLTITVTRILPDGTRCGTLTWRYKFIAKCGDLPSEQCTNDNILNGNFVNGLQGWQTVSGSVEHSSEMGCQDEGYVILRASNDKPTIMRQVLRVDNDTEKDYQLSICMVKLERTQPSGSALVIRTANTLQVSKDCLGDCDEVGRIVLDTFCPPSDKSNIVYLEDIKDDLYIHLENPYNDDGTPATWTEIHLDNICLTPIDRVTNDCPSCNDLQADLDAGVETLYYGGPRNECKRSWKPRQLSDCDEVIWTLRDLTTGEEVVQRTTGNDEVLFDLINRRHFLYIEEVIRTLEDGSTCSLTYSEEFYARCGESATACETDYVSNGDFQQGLSGWESIIGQVELDDGMGCVDVGFARLNIVNGQSDLLETRLDGVGDPEVWRSLTICIDPTVGLAPGESPPEGSRLIIRAANDRQDGFECVGDCYEAGAIVVDTFMFGSDLAISLPTLKDYLYLHLESPSGEPVEVGIDNICVRDSVDGISDLYWENRAIVFPNPTQQLLNLQFNQPLSKETSYRLYDLLGRRVKSGKIPKGNLQNQIDLSGLTDGLYILELQQDKIPVFMSRIVRQ